MVINNMKVLRAKHGLKAKHLAEFCGVSAQTMSSWENDKTRPSLHQMIILLKFYSNVGASYSLNDLFEVKFVVRTKAG